MPASYTPRGYNGKRAGCDLERDQGRVPDGLGSLVGARPRLRDLRDRAGVGPARADRAGACRRAPGAERLTSSRAWSDVAHNFRGDWQMLWKEITIGFLLAGFIAQFGNGFFESLFVQNAPEPIPTIENVVIGPFIAVVSFVCSVGNVPL